MMTAQLKKPQDHFFLENFEPLCHNTAAIATTTTTITTTTAQPTMMPSKA